MSPSPLGHLLLVSNSSILSSQHPVGWAGAWIGQATVSVCADLTDCSEEGFVGGVGGK